MEIIRRTIGWHGPGHKLPAIYDFCLHLCRTDIIGLSIVVIRLAWTYFKLFFHIMFTFSSLFFVLARLYIYYLHEFGYRRSRSIKTNVVTLLGTYTCYIIFMNIIIHCKINIIYRFSYIVCTFVDDITQQFLNLEAKAHTSKVYPRLSRHVGGIRNMYTCIYSLFRLYISRLYMKQKKNYITHMQQSCMHTYDCRLYEYESILYLLFHKLIFHLRSYT